MLNLGGVKMAEKLLQHKHCSVCGKAIQLEDEFCSDECKNKYEQYMKKRKQMNLVMYAMIALLAVVLIGSMFIGPV
jgi:predicted nucleic acid-binding Zn ribbon protein